jgi:ketosteroid isomerase-like protein
MQDEIGTLRKLEAERCEVIARQDFDRLEALLSPDLIHTHTRGNTDDRASYLRYLKETVEMLDVRRADLTIIMLADTVALMHGKQINRARLRGAKEELTVESMVTQVWARNRDGAWQVAAFHATSLGPPPPVVKR